MKREKYILIACLFLISSFALLAQEERFITVETEPANCTVKIYEWVPREGNKGDLIAEGESPLKISEATLKEAHGVIITVEAKKEGYLREERTLFPPYKFSLNTLEIQISKDYEYLARKAEQERKSEAERYRAEEAERRGLQYEENSYILFSQGQVDYKDDKYSRFYKEMDEITKGVPSGNYYMPGRGYIKTDGMGNWSWSTTPMRPSTMGDPTAPGWR